MSIRHIIEWASSKNARHFGQTTVIGMRIERLQGRRFEKLSERRGLKRYEDMDNKEKKKTRKKKQKSDSRDRKGTQTRVVKTSG